MRRSAAPSSVFLQDKNALRIQTKRICFTINDLERDEFWSMPTNAYFKRWIYQEEAGDETAHNHIQGYVELTQNRSLGWFRKQFSPHKPHVEKARDSAKTNYEYCTKSETKIPDGCNGKGGDWTDIDVTQGRRTDIRAAYNDAKVLKRKRDLYEAHPEAAVRYKRSLDELFDEFHQTTRAPDAAYKFLWWKGAPGTGKSFAASRIAPQSKIHYKDLSGGNNSWWDGLTNEHSWVILDDYDGEGVSYSQLKRIADKYPLKVQVKGGTREFHVVKVIVTSNKWPWEIWNTKEYDPQNNNSGDISPLMRRFSFWEFHKWPNGTPGRMQLYHHGPGAWERIKDEPTDSPGSQEGPPPPIDLTESDLEDTQVVDQSLVDVVNGEMGEE